MIKHTMKSLKLIKYINDRKSLKDNIQFYKDRISVLEFQKQRATSGSAKKSMIIEKAITHLENLESRLKETINENQDVWNFEMYDRMSDWLTRTQKQIRKLKTSQRKRVNVFEFSYELMDAIKERTNIMEMVDELKIKKQRSGGARYVILCPFHDEETPSCMVYVSEDRYHCFGCQASGDVIDFYQNILNIEFDEALTRLTDRLGIVLMDAEQVDNADKMIAEYKQFIKDDEDKLNQLTKKYKEAK